MTGGFLMGAQGVLPVQVVGGTVQILSAGLSTGLSWYRVRKYIREISNTLFAVLVAAATYEYISVG